MGRRCKHLNCTILEEFITCSAHVMEDGGCTSHDNSVEGDYTGKVEIQCHDCGRVFVFNYLGRRMPKWAQERLEAAEIAPIAQTGRARDF